MILYMVNINNDTSICSNIDKYELEKDSLEILNKNGFISFFTEYGEVKIMISDNIPDNNVAVAKEYMLNPTPINHNGYVTISQYNENKKLHSLNSEIPSMKDTLNSISKFHNNGRVSDLSRTKLLDENLEEYYIVKSKDKHILEKYYYKNGKEKHLLYNGYKTLLNGKLHSFNNEPSIKENYKKNNNNYPVKIWHHHGSFWIRDNIPFFIQKFPENDIQIYLDEKNLTINDIGKKIFIENFDDKEIITFVDSQKDDKSVLLLRSDIFKKEDKSEEEKEEKLLLGSFWFIPGKEIKILSQAQNHYSCILYNSDGSVSLKAVFNKLPTARDGVLIVSLFDKDGQIIKRDVLTNYNFIQKYLNSSPYSNSLDIF
jgi:hypothetical protein